MYVCVCVCALAHACVFVDLAVSLTLYGCIVVSLYRFHHAEPISPCQYPKKVSSQTIPAAPPPLGEAPLPLGVVASSSAASNAARTSSSFTLPLRTEGYHEQSKCSIRPSRGIARGMDFLSAPAIVARLWSLQVG